MLEDYPFHLWGERRSNHLGQPSFLPSVVSLLDEENRGETVSDSADSSRAHRSTLAAAVAERLARSPLIKANRVLAPAGQPYFRKQESCQTMPLVNGFSRGSPVSLAPSFRPSTNQRLITQLACRQRQPTGNLPHHAAANQTQGPLRETRAANDRMGICEETANRPYVHIEGTSHVISPRCASTPRQRRRKYTGAGGGNPPEGRRAHSARNPWRARDVTRAAVAGRRVYRHGERHRGPPASCGGARRRVIMGLSCMDDYNRALRPITLRGGALEKRALLLVMETGGEKGREGCKKRGAALCGHGWVHTSRLACRCCLELQSAVRRGKRGVRRNCLLAIDPDKEGARFSFWSGEEGQAISDAILPVKGAAGIGELSQTRLNWADGGCASTGSQEPHVSALYVTNRSLLIEKGPGFWENRPVLLGTQFSAAELGDDRLNSPLPPSSWINPCNTAHYRLFTTPVSALTVILGATADIGVSSSSLKTASLWRHVAAPHSNSDGSVRFPVTPGLNPTSPLKKNCRPLPSGSCQDLTYSSFRGNLVASLLSDTFSRNSEGLDITISHEIGSSGAVVAHGPPDVVATFLGSSGCCSEGGVVNGVVFIEFYHSTSKTALGGKLHTNIEMSLRCNPRWCPLWRTEKKYCLGAMAGTEYDLTEGLSNLLTKEKEDLKDNFTVNDYENYTKIVLDTNVAFQEYNPRKKINSNRRSKYKKINKPIYDNYIK
ncbi:hypothetical protein PR048_019609 [Dryococelus australis]|uniref:DUF8207 domain-containing protein n=1 Tax=Dryococelus australis TaxID=614101 RepID=A0ABQ9H3X4_9NEOP|nr:hypothetical protein PR048_019609 [Dryococelus australis]